MRRPFRWSARRYDASRRSSGACRIRRSASSLNHLGEVLTLKLGLRRSRAERCARRSQSARKCTASRSAEVAETLGLLARGARRTKANTAQGEPLIREALRHPPQAATATKPHPDVASSIEELGLNYYQRGEYDKAVAQLRDAAGHADASCIPTAHPALAQSIDNLAFALIELGKPGRSRAADRGWRSR